MQSIKKIAQKDKNVKVIVSTNRITVCENLGSSSNFDLRIQNHHVHVQQGKFVAGVTTKKKSKIIVSDTGTGRTIRTIKNGRHLNIVNKISYGQMINAMDSMNSMPVQKHVNHSSFFAALANILPIKADAKSIKYPYQKIGQKVKSGTHVHCNRFNGIHSNHHYYPRTYLQGLVNYYKSDCWYKHKAYHCPFTKADHKCNGLLKHHAHDCSTKGNWPVTCWYRN